MLLLILLGLVRRESNSSSSRCGDSTGTSSYACRRARQTTFVLCIFSIADGGRLWEATWHCIRSLFLKRLLSCKLCGRRAWCYRGIAEVVCHRVRRFDVFGVEDVINVSFVVGLCLAGVIVLPYAVRHELDSRASDVMTGFTMRIARPSCARSAAQPVCSTYLVQDLLGRVGKVHVSFKAVECLVESDCLCPVVECAGDIDLLS